MNKNLFIAFLVSVIIILILLAVIIFRKPVIVEDDSKTKWEDSIAVLNNEIKLSHLRQVQLKNSYDSLSSLEPRVIIKTHDKIKFIYSTATPDELDSIIRSNWKTESRYR